MILRFDIGARMNFGNLILENRQGKVLYVSEEEWKELVRKLASPGLSEQMTSEQARKFDMVRENLSPDYRREINSPVVVSDYDRIIQHDTGLSVFVHLSSMLDAMLEAFPPDQSILKQVVQTG